MKKHNTPKEALELLVDELGSQRAAADKLKISKQYINDLLRGYRDVSHRIAKVLGYKKTTIYTPVERSK